MWKDFPERLSDRTGCPALVFSRPGYGCSDPAPLPWKIDFMHRAGLDLMPAVIKAAGIRDHIVIGHSDGGSIGIVYAGGSHAGHLKGLITEAAHVFCETITVESIFQAKNHYEQSDLKPRLMKYHGENTENAFRGWNDVWLNPTFMHWNIEKYLSRIRIPMLAIQGLDDQYGTPAQIRAIQKRAPGVKTCLLKNCRHTPHLEQPDQVMDLMAAFVSGLIKPQ